MDGDTKPKIEVPSGCSTTDEFSRFKELAKQLVAVPKSQIQLRESKLKKSKKESAK